jgi:hypothetical protein
MFEDPFHGEVWLSFRHDTSDAPLQLAISVHRRWDTELLVPITDAKRLADAFEHEALEVVTVATLDGVKSLVAVEGDRLAVTIPLERISDVFTLGSEVSRVKAALLQALGTPR